MSEKKDTRVITINTKILSSAFTAEEMQFIDEYLNHYNHIKFITTSRLKKGHLSGLKIGEIKALCDQNNILPYRVFNSGLYQQVQAQIKSQLSNKKNYLDNVLDKLKSAETKLKKNINTILLVKSMSSVDRNRPENRQDLSKAMRLKSVYSSKVKRLTARAEQLEKEIKNGDFKICYGSASLLKKRNRIHKNDIQKLTAWKKEWNSQRYGQMLFSGSTDETLGNSNANITMNENNEFTLNITVPVSLKSKYSFSKVSVPIKVSYYPEELKNHIIYQTTVKKNFTYSKEEKEAAKKAGTELVIPTSSLSIRLMKNSKGDIDIGIGLNSSLHLKPDLKTHEKQGVVGVDINPDHLDVVETDNKGNYLKGWSVLLALEGKSTKQRKTILSQATKDIVEYALSKGKSIVLENLDFAKKKKALKDNYNKAYARMLSAFSYSKIKEYFTNQCWKMGVNLLFINPAFTSFLGNIKYGFKLRKSQTTVHTPAAYVIARRGQGFNERIPQFIIKIKKVTRQSEEVLTGERVPLRKMVFSTSSVKSWAKLVKIHKTLLKKVNLKVLSAEAIAESNLLTEIKAGSPGYQEVYVPDRLYDQVFITLK